jgi:phosphatidate cytidylyltransferase
VLTRIVTAALLLPLVALIYFGPPSVLLVITILATAQATREALLLHEALGARPVAAAALIAGALLCVSFHDPAHLPLGLALAASVALAVGLQAVLRPSLDRALPDLAATFACILYPGLLLSFQVAVRNLPADATAPDRGAALLVFLFAVVFGNDAAAYFVGRGLGRRRLAPTISPGKTVEGFLGGLLGAVVLGLVVARFLPTGLSMGQAAGWGALLAAAGVAGDLSKSMLKRSAHVKDSGHLLPGHGGVLDRLDGLLFAGPTLYYLVTASNA